MITVSVTYLSEISVFLNEMIAHLTEVNMAQNLKNKNKTTEQTLNISERAHYMCRLHKDLYV